MGHGNSVICKDCNYEREFMLGVGMRYGTLSNIVEFMDKKSRDEVLKILQEDPDPNYETHGHCVYQCRECFSIQEKLHLLIYNKEGKIIYRSQSKCSKCKIKRRRILEKNELLHQIICPKCKTKELTVSVDLLWD